MKKTSLSRFILLLLVAHFVVVQQAFAVTPSILNDGNDASREKWVNETYCSLSPRERIAQIIIMPVNASNGEEAREVVDKLVGEYKVGGIIYDRSDIVSQASLNNYAQSIASVPLMVAMDAEWGLTMRLSDAPPFPRNLCLGGVNDEKLLYDYGKEVARECRLMGVHVNFAPVLDVIDRDGALLANRSFGFDPDVVARNGIAFAKGLEDGGVLSTAKHFPGHGSTLADSHKELPLIDKSLQEMMLYDVEPFKKYIDSGLGGMLTAHVDVSFFDDGVTPCSLSKQCVTGLLKEQLGFQGLVFTDALEMEGAKAIDGNPCVNAILAGNDILLMPTDIEGSINAVVDAIDQGVISWDDIEQHCKKMLRYKYALGIVDTAKKPIDVDKVAGEINSEYAIDLNKRLIASAVTVATNKKDILPLAIDGDAAITVLTLGLEDQSMFQNRCANYVPTVACSTQAEALAGTKNNTVVIAVAQSDYVDAAIAVAKKYKHAIVAVLDAPGKLCHYVNLITDRAVDAVVMGYGTSNEWQDYVVQTIFGGNAARGVIPMPIKSHDNKVVLRAGTGVKYNAVRLGYTLPVEVGFKPDLLLKIDSVCNYGIKQGAFPGCQVLVARHGKIVCNRSYGEIDFNSGVPVTENTLYGLASVSKASGTLSGIMKLYDEGKFKLDEKASKYISGLRRTDKKDITFRQLLYHETGMQPSISMWDMMFDKSSYSGKLIVNAPDDDHPIMLMKGAYGHKDAKLRTDILSDKRTEKFNIAIADGIYGGKVTYDSVMNRIYHSQLRPNKNYCYSCLNFCLLADALQRITHKQLDEFVGDKIFGPLGSYHTTYRPLNKFSPEQIAYTEVDPFLRRQHIHGYVHDELAAFSGGVQGNAGLFSNANDLAKLFQMWLNGGEYGRKRFYKESTVDKFLTSKSPNSHRGLGFDKPNPKDQEASSTCKEATIETVGHTGFTGTCYWIDPKNDMIYIFLSNRVCPTRDNPAFTRVSARSHIHSLIYDALNN